MKKIICSGPGCQERRIHHERQDEWHMNDQELHDHRRTHDKSNSWWLNDARGIPLCRVCDICYEAAIDSYPPEVTGRSGRYEDVVDEQIEPDE